jgi:hypothetical protein
VIAPLSRPDPSVAFGPEIRHDDVVPVSDKDRDPGPRAFGTARETSPPPAPAEGVAPKPPKTLVGAALVLACLFGGMIGVAFRPRSPASNTATPLATRVAEPPPVATPTTEPPPPTAPIAAPPVVTEPPTAAIAALPVRRDPLPVATPAVAPTASTAKVVETKGKGRASRAKGATAMGGTSNAAAAATATVSAEVPAPPPAPTATETPEAQRARMVDEVFGR